MDATAAVLLGAVMLNAIHELDLLRWFVGDEVTSVYAESRAVLPDTEVPDYISIQLRFANGAFGASEIVTNLPHGYPYYHHLEVFGAEGMIRADDADLPVYRETAESGSPNRFPFPHSCASIQRMRTNCAMCSTQLSTTPRSGCRRKRRGRRC